MILSRERKRDFSLRGVRGRILLLHFVCSGLCIGVYFFIWNVYCLMYAYGKLINAHTKYGNTKYVNNLIIFPRTYK